MNIIFGNNDDLYNIINYIGFLVLLIFNFKRLRIKAQNLSNISLRFMEINVKKDRRNKVNKLLSNNVFWATIETILISCVQYLPVKFLNFGFGNLVGTGANYFGTLLFIPYILILFCWIIRVDPLFQIDLITPAFPLALCIAKIACFSVGCCSGVECTIGVCNHWTVIIEFPLQLLESVVALFIFVFLIRRESKFKPGSMLPGYIIIYSAIRFCTEFLSCEPNAILGLKKYQILCIIGVLIGGAELFAVRKFGDKIKNVCVSNIFKNRAKVKKV